MVGSRYNNNGRWWCIPYLYEPKLITETKDGWQVVAAGVGDCKLFRVSITNDNSKCSVVDISQGSRNTENINDASDPGGRLGPQNV